MGYFGEAHMLNAIKCVGFSFNLHRKKKQTRKPNQKKTTRKKIKVIKRSHISNQSGHKPKYGNENGTCLLFSSLSIFTTFKKQKKKIKQKNMHSASSFQLLKIRSHSCNLFLYISSWSVKCVLDPKKQNSSPTTGCVFFIAATMKFVRCWFLFSVMVGFRLDEQRAQLNMAKPNLIQHICATLATLFLTTALECVRFIYSFSKTVFVFFFVSFRKFNYLQLAMRRMKFQVVHKMMRSPCLAKSRAPYHHSQLKFVHNLDVCFLFMEKTLRLKMI